MTALPVLIPTPNFKSTPYVSNISFWIAAAPVFIAQAALQAQDGAVNSLVDGKIELVIEEIKQIQQLYPDTNNIMLNTDAIADEQYLINLCKALAQYNDVQVKKINFRLRINFLPKLL